MPGRAAHGIACRASGFSLLEMLLVLAIIAVASLVAAAAFADMDGLRLRSSTKEIAAQLRHTRTHAIATGRTQRFAIDPGARTWQAPDHRRGTIPAELGIVFTVALEVQPQADKGAIVFFADGASTGGRVQLQSQGAAWNVDVAWLTGEVTMHRDGENP